MKIFTGVLCIMFVRLSAKTGVNIKWLILRNLANANVIKLGLKMANNISRRILFPIFIWKLFLEFSTFLYEYI